MLINVARAHAQRAVIRTGRNVTAMPEVFQSDR
jgi:hypothetical protein